MFRELVMPRYRRLTEMVLPWVVHSDGNIVPFLHDLLSLGIAGLHPNEKGAMDIRAAKRDYGDRAVRAGQRGPEYARDRHARGGESGGVGADSPGRPGGGYIVTSGNSLAAYLEPENVMALRE